MSADLITATLLTNTRRVFEEAGKFMVADVRTDLGVPVWYDRGPRGGSIPIRSQPGEAPRRDTGTLIESITYRITGEGLKLQVEVFSDEQICDYAKYLTAMGRIIISDEFIENWSEQLPSMLANEI